MSENKKSRPLSEISQEFVNLASRAGQAAYQIDAMQKDLAAMYATMRDLNLEAAAVKAETEVKPV